MNTLAHFYLSGENIPWQIGNFIADFVKGKQIEQFNKNVQKGIILHRAIDHFTDTHEIVKQSKQRLFPKYRHYSAVIMDIAYDHFLAKNFHKYHELSLEDYSQKIYKNLIPHKNTFPEKAKKLFEGMVKYNWLSEYQYIDELQHPLNSLARRSSFESKMEYALDDIKNDYDKYDEEFVAFFKELIAFCENKKSHL